MSPSLALDGFTGSLEHLLALARAHQIDLARLSLPDLCDQLVATVQGADGSAPLSQRGEWLVMAAGLLLLRSRLLLSADDAPVEPARRSGLADVTALAAWLAGRPQLGHAVFPRGRPDWAGTLDGPEHQVDVIEFLWASMALFDADLPAADTAARYHPVWFDLHAVPDARERIRRFMADRPDGAALSELLPVPQPGAAASPLKRRSAWSSTFAASLELARQGEVALTQEALFAPIYIEPNRAR